MSGIDEKAHFDWAVEVEELMWKHCLRQKDIAKGLGVTDAFISLTMNNRQKSKILRKRILDWLKEVDREGR